MATKKKKSKRAKPTAKHKAGRPKKNTAQTSKPRAAAQSGVGTSQQRFALEARCAILAMLRLAKGTTIAAIMPGLSRRGPSRRQVVQRRARGYCRRADLARRCAAESTRPVLSRE